MLFVGSVSASFLLIGAHFGPAWTDYLLHGPGLHELGAYMLVTALACIGYGAVFLLCGLFFKNPMISAAVVWVWEGLNPFLPALLKKISVIFYLKNLCPVEIPVPPPFNVMVIDADATPFWIAVPGLLALAADPAGLHRHLRAARRNQLRGVARAPVFRERGCMAGLTASWWPEARQVWREARPVWRERVPVSPGRKQPLCPDVPRRKASQSQW